MASPKKSNTGLIVGLVIGGVVLCCGLPIGLLVGGGFWAFNKFGGFVTCGVGVTQLRSATLAYAKDHNGKLPKSETWMDDIRPYFVKEVAGEKDNPFKMSTTGAYSCKSDEGETGIAFNSALSGKEIAKIKDRTAAIVIFEIEKPSLNAAQKYKPLPESSSPVIMSGERRGWFSAPVEGAILLNGKEFSRKSKNGFSVEASSN